MNVQHPITLSFSALLRWKWGFGIKRGRLQIIRLTRGLFFAKNFCVRPSLVHPAVQNGIRQCSKKSPRRPAQECADFGVKIAGECLAVAGAARRGAEMDVECHARFSEEV